MVSVIPPSPPRQRVEKALGQKKFPPYYHPICLFLNVFAGDFTQLTPVQGKPIYLEKDFIRIWDEFHLGSAWKITSVEECKVCLRKFFNFYDRQW